MLQTGRSVRFRGAGMDMKEVEEDNKAEWKSTTATVTDASFPPECTHSAKYSV